MSDRPAWLVTALGDVGLAEIPGAKTAWRIERWLVEMGAWWRDDEAPWCGVAVAAWIRSAYLKPPPKAYRALAWLDWGITIHRPRVGAVVIFDRGAGKGHVGLVVGNDAYGRLMVVGGNQRSDASPSGAVTVAPFSLNRVIGYRWPADGAEQLAEASRFLPMIASNGQPVSRNEA